MINEVKFVCLQSLSFRSIEEQKEKNDDDDDDDNKVGEENEKESKKVVVTFELWLVVNEVYKDAFF